MEKTKKTVSYHKQGNSWIECELNNENAWSETQMHYSFDNYSPKQILDYAKAKYVDDPFYDYEVFEFLIEQRNGSVKTFTFARK